METFADDPLAGNCPSLLKTHSHMTVIGRELRGIDAEEYLWRLSAHENDCATAENRIHAIDDRLERMHATFAWSAQYLLATGVHPHERHQMKTIVESIVRTGRYTLVEAVRFLSPERDPRAFETILRN